MNVNAKILCIFLLMLISSIELSAVEIPNNFSLLDSLVSRQSRNFSDYCKKNNLSKIKLTVNGNMGTGFVEDRIMKAINANSILLTSSDSGTISFKVNIVNLGVKYEWANSEYSKIKRIISSDITFSESKNKDAFNLINIKSSENIDTLDTDYFDYVQSGDNDFAKSKLPPKNESFLDEVIEPVIVVGSVILTVVLLFSVRSN